MSSLPRNPPAYQNNYSNNTTPRKEARGFRKLLQRFGGGVGTEAYDKKKLWTAPRTAEEAAYVAGSGEYDDDYEDDACEALVIRFGRGW